MTIYAVIFSPNINLDTAGISLFGNETGSRFRSVLV